MRMVIALGGNALLKRGEPMTAEVQRDNVKPAAQALAPLARQHQVIISHGNGPQVGLLALQAAAYPAVEAYPLDVLGAQTEGMIGYLIEQELSNVLPDDVPVATLLTMVEVDPHDPAFQNPSQFVGPVYDEQEAQHLMAAKGWVMKPDGDTWRRVVPSPMPRRICEIRPIQWLLDKGATVICAGGGGIPILHRSDGAHRLIGVEAVIDKDLASALLARELEAALLVLATDVDGVYLGWQTPQNRLLRHTTPQELEAYTLAFCARPLANRLSVDWPDLFHTVRTPCQATETTWEFRSEERLDRLPPDPDSLPGVCNGVWAVISRRCSEHYGIRIALLYGIEGALTYATLL